MNKLTLLVTLLSVFTIGISAQEELTRPVISQRAAVSSRIKDIQTFDGRWGIASTADAIYRTRDGGATWNELQKDIAADETISSVRFADASTGYV
ncbi:MAG: hypothetical protein ABI481_05500, partial [Pyrinomonadaceae bacterium]